MALTVDQVVAAYLKLRNQKGEVQAEVKDKLDAINTKMAKLESWIQQKADSDGVSSFKTPHGTAFLTTVDFASVADWDEVVRFAKENDAYDIFEKRVSKNAVRGYIDGGRNVPAGINYGTRISVNIRKPTKKVSDE